MVFEVPCPKCNALLAFDETDVKQRVKCPQCRHKFTAREPQPKPAIPSRGCVLGCLGTLLATGSILLWLLGLGWTLLGFVCVSALVLNNSGLRSLLTKSFRYSRQRRAADSPPVIQGPVFRIRPSPAASGPTLTAHDSAPDLNAMPNDDLIEIQSAVNSPLPAATPKPIRTTSVTAARQRPSSRADFLGPETALQLDRGQLQAPLIYMTAGVLPEPEDPSTVEFGLPVGRPGILPGQDPPAWPTYRSFSSAQRSYYLDWLVSGRRTTVPLGYVILYLAGLERRILIDGQDHAAIAEELIGLLQAYGGLYSFRRDLSALLWLTIDLSCPQQPVPQSTVEAAIAATTDWNETLLRHCLATYAQQRWPIPTPLAVMIARTDSRTVNSVVVTRHADLFQTMFHQRLAEKFPQGLRLNLAGRPERIDYLIENPSLSRLPRAATNLTARPRVPTDSAELAAILATWDQCVSELKAYDRIHRVAESGVLTAEMWEALPEVARGERDHPELAAWQTLLQSALHQQGRPLVAVADLAGIKQIEPRGRLTRKQSEQLANTATHLNLAIEPDVRLTGKTYAWDEWVALFPRRTPESEDWSTYQAAAILLRLGMNIAVADGTVDAQELQRITGHLEQQFELTAAAAERLEHLRDTLIHSPASRGQLEKSLQERLTAGQRQVIGEFLVGIAVADGTISAAEMKALKKAWSALGLPVNSLEALLQQPEATSVAVNQPLQLDQSRISQIMQDTQRVAEMLKQAMSVDEEEDLPAVTAPEPPANPPVVPIQPGPAAAASEGGQVQVSQLSPSQDWSQLPARYHRFLQRMLEQPLWQRQELDRTARDEGLMLGGALEAINEWTQEYFGDWLTTEAGAEIHVQRNLLS